MLINMIMIPFRAFIEDKSVKRSNLYVQGEVISKPITCNARKDQIEFGKQVLIDLEGANYCDQEN